MATKKISELEAITEAEDDDVLVIVDASEETTKKIEKKYFLSELNGIVEELQEDLEDDKENQLTAPASGESIDLSDSAKAKIREPKLIGKSWQNTTTGKNLASLETSEEKVIDGLPFTVEDGIIKINGTNTSANSFFFDSFKTNSGRAMFWLEISGYTDKDSGNASILLQQSDDNINFSTLVEIQFKSNIGKTRQVTLDSNKYYRIRLYVNKNTFTNSEIKVQLEYGNSKTEWEKYTNGASPNPDYTQQIHRTGDNVNLFDKDNGEQGAIDATGNYVNNNTNWRAIDFIKVNPNTIYSFSIDRANITNNNRLRIYEYSQNKNFISPRKESIVNQDLTFTTGQNTEYIKYTIYIDNETMTSNIINSIKPKLELGSVVTPYSPYGCGNINEKVQNKNFLGLQDKVQTTSLGLTYSVKDGKIIINGTASSSGGIEIPLKSPINCKNGTNYVLSKVTSGTASNNNFNIQLRSNGASIKNPTAQSLPVTYNDLSGTIDGIRLYIGSGYVFTNYILELQLELGSTKTDYITHAEQNISFPLAQGQVLAEGDYLADDGIHHVRKQFTLDGSQLMSKFIYNSNLSTTNFSCFLYSDDEIKRATNDTEVFVLADKLKGAPSNQRTSDMANCWINHLTAGQLGMHVPNIITNTSELKTWLTENPITFEVPLAEEVIDPYTEEQQAVWEQIKKIKTYKTVTHISSPDETPATMDMVYVRDLQTVIDSLTNAIISLGGNV